jgi:hypothetical protein
MYGVTCCSLRKVAGNCYTKVGFADFLHVTSRVQQSHCTRRDSTAPFVLLSNYTFLVTAGYTSSRRLLQRSVFEPSSKTFYQNRMFCTDNGRPLLHELTIAETPATLTMILKYIYNTQFENLTVSKLVKYSPAFRGIWRPLLCSKHSNSEHIHSLSNPVNNLKRYLNINRPVLSNIIFWLTAGSSEWSLLLISCIRTQFWSLRFVLLAWNDRPKHTWWRIGSAYRLWSFLSRCFLRYPVTSSIFGSSTAPQYPVLFLHAQSLFLLYSEIQLT